MNRTDLDNQDARKQTDLERTVNRLQNALGYADLSYLATPDDIETIVGLTERMRPYIERVFGPVDLDQEP